MESHQPQEVRPLLPILDLEGDLDHSAAPSTSTTASMLCFFLPFILAGVVLLGIVMSQVVA